MRDAVVISLRGTNGSGKSTLVRRIMDLYPTRVQIAYPHPGKRRPMGIVLHKPRRSELFVPGHYDIANGGVDTLPSLDLAYDLIEKHHVDLGMSVLYEGKNMSDGVKRLIEMHGAGVRVQVVHLKTPVGKCVADVRRRGHAIKEDTIIKLHTRAADQVVKFKSEGVPVHSLSREGAYEHLRRVLGV